MIIVPGPGSQSLGKKIAEMMGVNIHAIEYREFPDGENYVRFTSHIQKECVVIIHTTMPNPDKKILQLYLMVATARDLKAGKIVCVTPYLAYTRQDKRFLEGEAISQELIVELLEKAGADELIVIDAHNDESLKKLKKKRSIKITNFSAIPLLAKHLKKKDYGGANCISPDKGAVHLAKTASKIIEGEYGFFEKIRDRKTGEIDMKIEDLDLSGNKAIIFDDIISSGGTMALAIKALKSQGIEKIAASCTHGLFMGNSIKKILKAGATNIVSSDSVENPFSKVSIAPLIVDHLKKF